jgi:ribose transport system ATP-binding protein
MSDPILELRDVTKSFIGVTALAGVSFAIRRGEVLGLVGENGAGKSTLLKILGGVLTPTSGAIAIDGEERQGLTVREAIEAGIAFVHQELNLFDNLDVAANIFIGREPLFGGPLRLVNRRRMRQDTQVFLDMLGVDFKPDTLVATMSIAERQLLEVAKALSLKARILILDEPTSSLTLSETARLMQVIAQLKSEGVTIIFVTHRLNELVECADRVVALRDGRFVGELEKHEISHGRMIGLMIGRDLKSLYAPPARPPGDAALEVIGVRTEAYPDEPISLSVRRGEILGLAGLMGAGRTELARAIFGIDRILGGEIRLEGEALPNGRTEAAITRGIFLVPEDRKKCGIVLDMSIMENIALPKLSQTNGASLVNIGAVREASGIQMKRLAVRAQSGETLVRTLSGGNQQKVALAKWLTLNPHVLICDEPTRGIDVGAKQEIYDILRQLADAGVAILMISSDMEEVIGVSDRIAVMHEGALSGILERSAFSETNVLQLAVGKHLN